MAANPQPRRRALGVVILFCMFWEGGRVCRPCAAENIFPGKYQGVYHRDRWRQHRFGFLFVSPKLESKLASYRGLPISLDATEIDQPISPGGAMIAKIGAIRKLPRPLDLKISWRSPSAGPTPVLRQIQQGDAIELDVKATNLLSRPFALNEKMVQTCFLTLAVHAPSGPGMSDSLDYWSRHETYWQFHRLGDEPALTICERPVNLAPRDATLKVSSFGPPYSPYRPEDAPVLKSRGSHTWTTRIEDLPPNEYELSIEYRLYDEEAETHFTVESNVLRLDVLAGEPIVWKGLKIDLNRAAAGHRIPLEARLTNHADHPLRFNLEKCDGKLDLSGHLVCYDREGERLSALKSGPRETQPVRLEPNDVLTIPVECPPNTALARVAFRHVYHLPKAKAGDVNLDFGYAFSPHLWIAPTAPR
jgi:hypothetical protein